MVSYRRIAAFCLFSIFPAFPAAGQDPASGTVEPGRPAAGVNAPLAEGQVTDEPAPTALETRTRRERSDEWKFTLSPYLWATSLRSDVDAGPISAMSDVCFSDLLKDLDGAAQMRFEGMKDRWGFYLDGTYISLSDDPRVKIDRFPIGGLEADVDFTQAWLDFGGIYQFGDPGCTFDLMAGGRWSYTSTDVSLGPFEVNSSEDYLTPVVGGRFEYALSERWLVSFKADFSEFGVDNGADLTWGVTGLLGYQLSDHTTVGFGYRYYDIDFDGGRADVDLKYYGPIVGLSFSF